jgi:hypothetical protein
MSTSMDAAIDKAIAALDAAERQFTSYAEHHRAKGATDKAATNYGYATVCGDALERLKLEVGRAVATSREPC